MSNFWQRKVAREDAGTDIVPDNTELPLESVEGVLSEVASDTAVIDQQDNEAALLTEDANETDEQYAAVDADVKAAEAGEEGVEEDIPEDAVEQIDVAQESVRRRWGLNNRQTCARESYGSANRRVAVRESLWDDLKAFFRRIWEWLKAQGRKLKDRWVNFHNQGKTIQTRSKKFDAAIRQLGSIKSGQDELKGGFIKQLSIGGKFVGSDTNVLNAQLAKVGTLPATVEALLKEGQEQVEELTATRVATESKKKNKGNKPGAAVVQEIVQEKAREFSTGVTELLGSQAVKVEGEGDDFSISLIDSEKDVETEVKTPAIAAMNSINTFYNKLGIEVEKRAKAYEKINADREKFENAIEKLLAKIDKIDAKDDTAYIDLIRSTRRDVSNISTVVGVMERVQASTITFLSSGVNGYLSAAIGAYEKRKS